VAAQLLQLFYACFAERGVAVSTTFVGDKDIDARDIDVLVDQQPTPAS
jgi:hypothetical protein